MSNDDVARVLKLLEKVGYQGSLKEFTEALTKFKGHPEALGALRKGVARDGREQDRGSYCENASSGYSDWWKKNDMLEKIDLEDDRAFLKNAAPGTLQSPRGSRSSDTLQELREQVQELTERIALLEKRAIRGPSLSPRGP